MDRIRKFTDEKFFFMQVVDKQLDRLRVHKLKMSQSDYSLKEVYYHLTDNEEIAEFDVDKNRFLYIFVR